MVLKKDGKGMISMVDAMIFVTVLSLVSTSMFAYYATECREEPMAKSVCENLISIKLRASDVMDSTDSDVYPISDLIASGMKSGKTDAVEKYIRETLDDLVPGMFGYGLVVSYGGRTMTWERNNVGNICSEYSVDVGIINGNDVTYSLAITE